MERKVSQIRAATIRHLIRDGWTVADLALIYGLKPKTIWGIKYKKNPVDNLPLDKNEEREYNSKHDNK
jgi:hypothetical protein